MAITKNIVTNYGADNTGVSNVVPAFYSGLKPDMAGQDCDLTIPSGSYNFATFGGSSWINGALDLDVEATGATLFGSLFLATDHLTQIGIDHANGKSARIQTANIGATSVTLTAASAGSGHISRFSVGQWIMICGWTIQSSFQSAYSFPPNFAFHEFRQISSIVDDAIFFSTPLAYYYSSEWPEMNRGSAFEVDAAGPATIFAMSPYWAGTTTFNGGSYDNANLINCYRENFIMNGGESLNLPIYPSVTRLFRAINHTATGALTEHDKLCDLVDIQGGEYSQWKCQSGSTHLTQLTDVTLGSLNGTAGNTVLDGCTITGGITIGPVSYGRADTFVARNTSIGGAVAGGLQEKGITIPGVGSDTGVDKYMRMSNGLITMSMSSGDFCTRTMMPDASGRNVLHWAGTNGSIGSFRVLSATSDSWPAADAQSTTTNITISTNSRTLVVSDPIFTADDVYKTIYLPGFISNNNYSNGTITNASPGVVTRSSHGFVAGDPVRFRAGSGVLPSEITAGTTYYVTSTNLATNTFTVATTVGGAAINTSGGSGTIEVSYTLNLYTFITGYTDSQTVSIFYPYTGLGLTAVARSIQWGTCNMYIQTDQEGGLPASGLWSGAGKLYINVPPARSVRFENCTGTGTAAIIAQIADLSQPAAWNRPLNSYSKRTYNGLNGAPAVATFGSIVSIKVNVITPYTGASSTLIMTFSQFNNLNTVQSDAYASYGPKFNLKIAGERVITIGSTTGAQSGDTGLNLSVPTWLQPTGGGFAPFIGNGSGTAIDIATVDSGDTSKYPEFTIEVITDQGFPAAPVAVAPLRLRLRAA